MSKHQNKFSICNQILIFNLSIQNCLFSYSMNFFNRVVASKKELWQGIRDTHAIEMTYLREIPMDLNFFLLIQLNRDFLGPTIHKIVSITGSFQLITVKRFIPSSHGAT